MSLKEQIKETLKNFESTSPDNFLKVLNQVKPHFKSKLTLDYLEGKMQKIANLSDEVEKKKQCKALIPYLDWYLQGL
ncbi:MAG: hypothetical protein ACR2LL_13340 [Nitrosopumilus sp.]